MRLSAVGKVFENGHATTVSVLRRAPVAVFASFFLVFAQRGGLPGDGELLAERQNTCWLGYQVIMAAGAAAGIGLYALPPVRKAVGSGFDTKTIALSCGKLITGVTVPQWSSILMLCNLKSPESYFQAAFRVPSPWSIKNPNGDNPNEEEILKPVCFVFDFAPTRTLRLLSYF